MKLYGTEKPIDTFRLNKTKGEIALEMEVEGDKLPSIRTRAWNSHSDGSLRLGGMEYVSNGPIAVKDVLPNLQKWEERLAKAGSTVYQTDRTSVHVHLNQQDKTFKDIIKGATAYYLLENALFNHCGEGRKGNLFCLSMKDSPILVNNMRNMFTRNGITRNSYRYAALNLEALAKFGSVEVRSMRGVYSPEFLEQWSTNLNSIFNKAVDFKEPKDVLDYLYGRSYKDFCAAFLSDDFIDTLSSYKDWDIDSQENASSLGKFLYTTDFDKERPKKEKRPESTDFSYAENVTFNLHATPYPPQEPVPGFPSPTRREQEPRLLRPEEGVVINVNTAESTVGLTCRFLRDEELLGRNTFGMLTPRQKGRICRALKEEFGLKARTPAGRVAFYRTYSRTWLNRLQFRARLNEILTELGVPSD